MIDGPRLAPLAGGRPDGLIVLLHGYGSNGDEMIHFASRIQPSLPNVAFVAPHAPGILPNLADGRLWWPIESFSAAETARGVATAAPDLAGFVDHELQQIGLPDDRLLLAGFSQGAMLALHFGLRTPVPLAGIVGIAGLLAAADRLPAEIESRPPVLLIHGTEDEVVPFRSLDQAVRALRAVGVPLEAHVSPGTGHDIAADGLAVATSFAVRLLA